MGASGAEVELLFTTYLIVMSVAMLVSGVLSARFGNKRVIIAGLSIVVVMALLAGLSNSILELAIVRGGWGFGNALFTSTALAVIVGLSSGAPAKRSCSTRPRSGLGIAGGPLLGGLSRVVLVALPLLRNCDVDDALTTRLGRLPPGTRREGEHDTA